MGSPVSGWIVRWRWPLGLVVVLAGAWLALAAYFLVPVRGIGAWLAGMMPVLLALAALWSLCPAARRRWPLALFAAAFGLAVCGFGLMQPRHDRDWADDVARLLQAEVDGDRVVLHNVRNFDWRSETDYTPRWETREYDLSGLRSADLVLSYWMGPAIAHTLVSFGFDDGRQLVFSLEIRKERGERFSALGGFFHQFEQVLVAADERDILRVRSNVRGEDVYLYRLDMPPRALREAFLGYLGQAARLQQRPYFYNTLTSNCTTIVFELARQLQPRLPLDYRLLLSGHFAEYAYDHDGLVPGFDYLALQSAGRFTQRALQAGDAADYSRRIRVGVPGADPREALP